MQKQFQTIFDWWCFQRKSSNKHYTNEQMSKSSAKKHPPFLLAMCPARMWAPITRNAHRGECWSYDNLVKRYYQTSKCTPVLTMYESGIYWPDENEPACNVKYASNLKGERKNMVVCKVLKLWMCFQAHWARCRKTLMRFWRKQSVWLIWNSLLEQVVRPCDLCSLPEKCPRMHFCFGQESGDIIVFSVLLLYSYLQ